MDTLTQISLGAAVAGICVPAHDRRRAVLIGAVLGTTPDLDVFIDYGDSVSNYTFHRGFSHSLFVLFPFSLLLWVLLRKFYNPVRTAPLPWLLAITLALTTHPLLDAHTAYGTQLFWPMTSPPVMWSTIFIIDPLYTIPILLGVIVILVKPQQKWAARTLFAGIFASTSYLAWTWSAKLTIENKAYETLSNVAEQSAIFSTPTPFNSLLWRVVVLQQNDYLEGYYSLLNPSQRINFKRYSKNKLLFEKVDNIWSARRLDWFAHGFIKSIIVDDYLVISDIRMGFEDHYVFNHAIAKIGNPHFYEIDSKLMPSGFGAEDLGYIWKKL